MGLQQFEQRLERLVEGAFAKAFRGELQPVELGRRLTREMDLQRAVTARGIVAPNSFTVLLSKDDFERFGGLVDVLARELVDAAREHARAESYIFVGPVRVVIDRDEELSRSTFMVGSDVVEGDDDPPGWILLPDGRKVVVEDYPISIGRLPECDIPLSDANASRRHAEIRRDGADVYIVDLDSTNGTRVNGTPVREHRLAHGDVITVGITTFRFESS